jgi:predicted Rossmann fold nucleotide-binding protein DprA/Smf involved in DNA uptake
MTSYGKHFIEEFLEILKNKKVLIVSGLALGTDGCAHTEALKPTENSRSFSSWFASYLSFSA